MIPTTKQILQLWEKYRLPEKKRVHVTLVAKVADFLGKRMNEVTLPRPLRQSLSEASQRAGNQLINESLLHAAALLHDIDKNAPKLPGEVHPDACVRILRYEGMEEIADIVKTHSVHAILNQSIAPKAWEEKLLFLADKMVKQSVVGVDERFRLWNEEDLRAEDKAMLARALPLVKALESEIAGLIRVEPREILSELQKMESG